ncbi:MAG: hypothetical protein K8H90_00360, partial [Thermoanaerobaculia bacterium]|nr:hypothetical protein [Thermoanaerobaculia bacterium]
SSGSIAGEDRPTTIPHELMGVVACPSPVTTGPGKDQTINPRPKYLQPQPPLAFTLAFFEAGILSRRRDVESENQYTSIRLAGLCLEDELSYSALSQLAAGLSQRLIVFVNGPDQPVSVPAEEGRVHRAVQAWLKDRLLPSRVVHCMECPVAGPNGKLVIAESHGIGLVLFFATMRFVESMERERLQHPVVAGCAADGQ